MSAYTLGDAARILKVSPERLRYWERTALLRFRSIEGERATLGFRDLVCVRALLGLLDQGVSLRRVRSSVDALRARVPGLDDPVSALRLWSEGSARVVLERDGVLEEPDGQMVLDFRTDADGSGPVAELCPPRATPKPSAAAGSGNALEPSALEWFERGCAIDSEPKTRTQAASAYRHAIEIDPEFADAHCNLGAVLYNLGQRGSARRCFERSVELEPGHVEANFNLANLLEEDGMNLLALQHYLSALDTDPLYPDLHINLALLYEKIDRRTSALEHWRGYLKLVPTGCWSSLARNRLEG